MTALRERLADWLKRRAGLPVWPSWEHAFEPRTNCLTRWPVLAHHAHQVGGRP